MPAIHFYDALTVGKNAAEGQVLGYDSIIADGVSPELVSTVRVSLRDDLFIDPQQVLDTDLPAMDLNKGMSELEWAKLAHQHLVMEGCLHVGLANTSKSDAYIKHGIYRNLLPYPCTGISDNRYVLDLETILRAINMLRPEEYPWPDSPTPDIPTSFHHYQMWEAKVLGSNRAIRVKEIAHDVAKASPRLFEHAIKQASLASLQKALGLDNGEVSDLLSVIPSLFVHSTIPTTRRGVIGIPIGADITYPDIIFVADLESDLTALCDPSSFDYQQMVRSHPAESTKPLIRVSLSRMPFVSRISSIRAQDAHRLGVDFGRIQTNIDRIRGAQFLPRRLKDDPILELNSQPADVYYRLWAGDFPPSDIALMKQIHNSSPETWPEICTKASDGRFQELAIRMLGRESPDLLSAADNLRWVQYIQSKAGGDSRTPDRLAWVLKQAQDNANSFPSLIGMEQLNTRLTRIFG